MNNGELNEMIQLHIDEYVKKYSNKHKISEEEARQHAFVKLITAYYKKGQNR